MSLSTNVPLMFRQLRRAMKDRRARLLRPDLYDDAVQRQRLEELAARISGRHVAVVGNAQSIFDGESGNDIDRSGLVVRINRGFVLRPECQGSRTDVVCLATAVSRREIADRFASAPVICVTPWRWTLSASLLADRERLSAYPLDAWSALSERIGGARPSAGLLAVDMSRTFLKAATVNLYGFDWKATKTFYVSDSKAGHHDWAAERCLMAEWSAEGWLRLPPGATVVR